MIIKQLSIIRKKSDYDCLYLLCHNSSSTCIFSNLMILISWIRLFLKMNAAKSSSINANMHQDRFKLNQLKPSALLLLLKNVESLPV